MKRNLKTIIIATFLIALLPLISSGLSIKNQPHFKVAAVVPDNISLLLMISSSSDILDKLLDKGTITPENIDETIAELGDAEIYNMPERGIRDIFEDEIAIALYDRREYGEKSDGFSPGILIVSEITVKDGIYNSFQNNILDSLEAKEENSKSDYWSSKTDVKIKKKKHQGGKYYKVKIKEKTETTYDYGEGEEETFKTEDEQEFCFGRLGDFFVLALDDKVLKEAFDNVKSKEGIADEPEYIECATRVDSNSDIITYMPDASFDSLVKVYYEEMEGIEDIPETGFAEFIGGIDAALTASTFIPENSVGPTGETVILLPELSEHPFVRMLGDAKVLEGPNYVPAGFGAYIFYSCNDFSELIVDITPNAIAAIEETDANTDGNNDEIASKIAGLQELSPGLYSSLGDEFVLAFHLSSDNYEEIYDENGMLLEEDSKKDNGFVAFNIRDISAFETSLSILSENVDDKALEMFEENGVQYYLFGADGNGDELIIGRRGDWAYGAFSREMIDSALSESANKLNEDEAFTKSRSNVNFRNNVLVYLDYSTKIDKTPESAIIPATANPTIIGVIADDKAIEIESYPYSFWNLLYSLVFGFGFGATDAFYDMDIDETPIENYQDADETLENTDG